MNVPVSKLFGVGEGVPESRDGVGAGELSSGSSSSDANGALLHVAEGDLAHRVDAMLAEADAASPKGSGHGERLRPSPRLPAASLPPATDAAPPRREPDPGRFWRANYLAGALVLAALALAAFAFGRLRASSELAQSNAREPAPTQQTRSGLQPPPARAEPTEPIVTPRARDLPLIPFVPVEVEPAHAEIWLDRELVGRGRLQLGAVQDGMMHELRFVAPGHETTILFFRDLPPAGRVILKRTSRNEGVAANPDVEDAAREPPRARADEASADDESVAAAAEQDAPARRARRTVAQQPAARARLPAEDPAATPAVAKPEARKPPQVQLIEVHTPRVQVLD